MTMLNSCLFNEHMVKRVSDGSFGREFDLILIGSRVLVCCFRIWGNHFILAPYCVLSWPGRLSASTSSPALPAPELSTHSRSEDTAVLACRAPRGQRGVLFMLYRYDNKVSFIACGSTSDSVFFSWVLFLLLPLRWTPRSSRSTWRRSTSL